MVGFVCFVVLVVVLFCCVGSLFCFVCLFINEIAIRLGFKRCAVP